MKEFIANVIDIRHTNFTVFADSKKEAAEKVKDIIDNTDLLDNADAEYLTAIKVIEAEDDYDGDDDCDECEGCIYEDDGECLLDELY